MLVHCVAGVSRSATVITAYLMRLKNIRYKAALAMLKRVRPIVTPNDGFIEQLRLYQTMGNRVDVNHPDYKKFVESHSNQDEAGKSSQRPANALGGRHFLNSNSDLWFLL